MKIWLCMDCMTETGLNRHGRCECCDSEAVHLSEKGAALAGQPCVAQGAENTALSMQRN
jgi:hypothetical protein